MLVSSALNVHLSTAFHLSSSLDFQQAFKRKNSAVTNTAVSASTYSVACNITCAVLSKAGAHGAMRKLSLAGAVTRHQPASSRLCLTYACILVIIHVPNKRSPFTVTHACAFLYLLQTLLLLMSLLLLLLLLSCSAQSP